MDFLVFLTKNFLMVQAPGFIRGINPKLKIENPQAPAFIRGVNLKSQISNLKSIDLSAFFLVRCPLCTLQLEFLGKSYILSCQAIVLSAFLNKKSRLVVSRQFQNPDPRNRHILSP